MYLEKLENLQKKYHSLLRDGREMEMLPIIEEAINLAFENKDNKKLIEVLNDYGGALRNTGNYEKSIKSLNLAKTIFEKYFDTNSEAYANTIMNLANAYRMNSNKKEAIRLFEEANSIYEVLNLYNYSYASNANNLALLYLEDNNAEKAYNLLKSAEEILKSIPHHSIQLATTYNNLFDVSLKLNKISEAKEYIFKAKDFLESKISPNNPLYASVLNNLAKYYFNIGDIEKSKSLYIISKKIIENTYGKESEAYKNIESNLNFIEKKSDTVLTFDAAGKNLKKGLEISEDFYLNEVKPFVLKNYPDLFRYSAFGLIGEGSECYGFDDEISRDHDFIKKCSWFLPKDIMSHVPVNEINLGDGVIKIISIEDFYKYYTLFEKGPLTLNEFRKVPQDLLSVATNGKVFEDNYGKFSYIRQRLLAYYPKDLVLKKLAYLCNKIAQSGQYNYPRCLKRNNLMGAQIALSEFLQYYCEFIHLINKKYMPFYKWQYSSLKSLPLLGEYTCSKFDILLSYNDVNESLKKIKIIEELCEKLVKYLNKVKLSNSHADFLKYHSFEIAQRINNIELKNEDTWIK
ncbi:MAG: DUF4037 domain-containing protein [Peptoniphilaceae bacterium]|uniref:DUF4037 domain-containing protein n=1 Tax=Peptoniphilus sp. TaxID=1971214 RepID=UPI0029739F55|nr:DUF4037 domain-containing protein [Peptoniphilus sp.]MDD7353232.1 DUF4037 domain-containing protein [Peptoniphilaceae bacterium]MDY3903147.1 DUF4037 domain-containing protein [Peptoniphilus sp.]